MAGKSIDVCGHGGGDERGREERGQENTTDWMQRHKVQWGTMFQIQQQEGLVVSIVGVKIEWYDPEALCGSDMSPVIHRTHRGALLNMAAGSLVQYTQLWQSFQFDLSIYES